VLQKREQAAIVWEVATGATVRPLADSAAVLGEAAFSTDGTRVLATEFGRDRRATALDGKRIRVWQVASGSIERATESEFRIKGKAHRGGIESAVFSPDRRLFVTGSDHDCDVKLWDTETGSLLRTIRAHDYPEWTMAFSPRGDLLATGHGDALVKLWRVP
jgi:WD40 repeat protein